MSANRWSQCPKCGTDKYALDKAVDKMNNAYGKVPAEKYHELYREARKIEEMLEDAPETLRENWEVIRTGLTVTFIYRCSCDSCNWSSENIERDFEL